MPSIERFFSEKTFTRQIARWLFDLLLISPVLVVLYLSFTGYYDEHPAYRIWGLVAAMVSLLIARWHGQESLSLRTLVESGAAAFFLWALIYGEAGGNFQLVFLVLGLLLALWQRAEENIKD